MYYIYKKSKSSELPEFDYIFRKFEDFYEIAKLLNTPLIGNYYIQVKSDSYKDIIKFIEVSNSFSNLIIYVEVSESMLEYICLHRPDISLLDSKSNFEIFKELISKYSILFEKGCIETTYFAIGHSYAEMDEALELIQRTFPNKKVSRSDLEQLFVMDNLVYPRSVCIAYLRMDKGRAGKLKKCIEHFGNDLVFYSMRKTTRKFLKDKIEYLKTGNGNGLIKILPADNIVKLLNTLDYSRGRFMDITTLLNLYEKGVTVHDTLQERTGSSSDEEYYALR